MVGEAEMQSGTKVPVRPTINKRDTKSMEKDEE